MSYYKYRTKVLRKTLIKHVVKAYTLSKTEGNRLDSLIRVGHVGLSHLDQC